MRAIITIAKPRKAQHRTEQSPTPNGPTVVVRPHHHTKAAFPVPHNLSFYIKKTLITFTSEKKFTSTTINFF